MKKIFLVFSVLIIFFASVPVQKTDAAAPVVARVVSGSVGERVIVGMAEKAGVKLTTKTARKKAVERWNLEVQDKIDEMNLLGKQWEAEELARFQNTISSMQKSELVPTTNPGWSKAILSTTAFLTGADIIYDIYAEMKLAQDQEKEMEVLADVANGFRTGEYANDIGNFSVKITYTTADSFYGVVEEIAYSHLYKDGSYIHSAGTFITPKYPFYSYLVIEGDRLVFKTFGTQYSKTPSERTDSVSFPLSDIIYSGDAQRKFTPVSIGSVDPLADTVQPLLDPLRETDFSPLPPEVPSTYPETEEIVIPEADDYPEEVSTPWNEPYAPPIQDTPTDPTTDPEPEPTPVPPTDTPTEEPTTTNVDAPWWKWLLAPLAQILEWLKYLIELLKNWFSDLLGYLQSIIQWLMDIFSAIGNAALDLLNGLKEFFTPLWQWLTDILNAILALPELIASAIGALFVPVDGYFVNFFSSINSAWSSKIPFLGQIYDFFAEVKSVVIGSQIPVVEVDLPERYGGKTMSVVDFSYFTQYRDWILNFIRFTAWFIFLKRLYARIPKVIGG